MELKHFVVAMAVVAAGCSNDQGGTGNGAAYALSPAQLADQLAQGPQRVEVTLRADGSVRELEVEAEGPGHTQQLAGRVLAVDAAAQRIEVEYLGTVDFSGANRFRSPTESSVDQAAWLAAVDSALTLGDAVFVDTRGVLGFDAFVADEVRWEADGRTKLEVDVDHVALDMAAGTLTVGDRVFSMDGAVLRRDDGNDDGNGDDGAGHDVGDDHGNDGAEAGDDNGNDGAEAGDDNGNDGAEAGDDNGNDGAEAGDDNGNDGAEAGDDNGNDGAEAEAGDDNGNDGAEAEAGDDNGTDGAEAEAGDDNGTDAPEAEAGDDNGTDAPEAEAGDDNGTDAPEAEAGDDNGTDTPADEGEDHSGRHGGRDDPTP